VLIMAGRESELRRDARALRRHHIVILDCPIARPASLVTLKISVTPAVKVAAATA